MIKWILCVLFLAGSIDAANITIVWKDSVVIEEAGLYNSNPTLNLGRALWSGIPATRIGDNYGNNRDRTLFRVNTFKDSTDLHDGLIIDSMVLALVVRSTATIEGAEYMYLQAFGIDTNMNWVEGNRDANEAQDCEVSYDSAQQVGSGTCASKQAWNTAGATGAADTMGTTTGKPSDSALINEATATGDIIKIWVDTTVGNVWKLNAYSNEGFLVYWTTETIASGHAYFYSSEYNGAGRADSISTFTLYGHTEDVGPSGMGQIIIIGSIDEDILRHYAVTD